MSHSRTSSVDKDNSLSIPEILADFFLRKIDMPSHSDDSDHKHKSKRKKSKHKKHKKHKKSKYRHRSSNSDTSSKASELKRKVIANDVSSSEEKDIKRLKKIKGIKCQSTSKSVIQSIECDPNDESDLPNTETSPIFYGPSLELLFSDKGSNNSDSKVLCFEEPKNFDSEPNLNVPNNSIENDEIKSYLNVENISIENQETDSNVVRNSNENESKYNLTVATNSIENNETVQTQVQTPIVKQIVSSSTNSETKINKSLDKVSSSIIQSSDAVNSVDDLKNDTKDKSHCDVQKASICETSNKVVESSNDEKDKSDIGRKSEPNLIKTKNKSSKKKHSRSRSRSKSRSKHRSPKSKHKRRKSRSSSRDSYHGSRKKKKHSRSHSRDRKRRSYSRSCSRSRYQKHRRLSRSPVRRRNRSRRSRSRSHSYTRYRKRSESRTRRHSRSERHRSVSKSRYRNTKSKRSDTHSRSKSKSKSRHSSKSKERTKDATSSHASTKIDQAKVLETARKNVLKMMKSGTLPEGLPVENLKKEQLISIQAGGKSVQELTDFCQRLSQKENDPDGSENEDNEDKPDDHTGFIHHPFKVKEPGIIKLNIKNAVQLPIKTHAQKIAELSSQFPVSSGNQHKKKELEWVPVVPEEKSKTETKPPEKIVSSPAETKNAVVPLETPIPPIPPPPPPPPVPASYTCPSVVPQAEVSIPAPMVIPPPVPTASIPLPLQTSDQSAMFYQMPVQPAIQTYVTPTQPMIMSYSTDSVSSSSSSIFKPPKKLNIPSIVTKRFQALQKLQEDPTDPEALRILEEAKESIQEWVQSQQVPGLFTGSTDAKVLTAAELCGPFKHQKFRKKIDFSLHEIVLL